MTLNRFFLLFLASSLIIYFGIDPYVIDQKKIKNIPQLEFKTFVSYEIEGEQLSLMLVGEEARRYPRRLKVKDFALYREANNTVQTISALEGDYRKKRLILNQSVQYQGENGLLLETEKADFNLKHNTLDIRVPFTLTREGSVFTGSSLFFNQNNDRITAKDVRASFIINN